MDHVKPYIVIVTLFLGICVAISNNIENVEKRLTQKLNDYIKETEPRDCDQEKQTLVLKEQFKCAQECDCTK